MFLGFVVLIIGRDGDAELYSPEGQCNYQLAQTPVRQTNPVLVYANNRIITCGGQASCWEYNIKEDSWLEFTHASFKIEYQPGVVHGGKLYIIDSSQAQVLDLTSNTWSTWAMPPNKFGQAHWMVGWKDSIILLGGNDYPKSIQIFNITSQTWAVQNSANVPMDLEWSSSLLTTLDEVLIVGSDFPAYYKSAAKYYPVTDSWVKLQDSQINHWGTRLVKLGSRIFAIDGGDTDTVEEFFATNNTWSLIGVRLIQQFDGHHSVVALPSSLFAHLPGGCHGVY